MDMRRIGKNIAYLRKGSGYTQEALAEKLGISPQAVSKWETGAGLPEASLLPLLSGLFRVSIDGLLQPEKKDAAGFFSRNLAAPAAKMLDHIPRVDRWNPPPGCDMFYSMPAMIAEALCCIEAWEQGRPQDVTMEALNGRFRDLMHVMGIGYGFLWFEKRHMIEELWRVNAYEDMIGRAMGYYGRDYLWLTRENAAPDDMRRAVVWSIDRGRPAVMEWAGGIPEFSIITGYEGRGGTLTGWTYCGECAARTNEKGMFVNPARWDEDFRCKVLVIGDAATPTYTDRDSILYALEVLDRAEPQGMDTMDEWGAAGDAALRLWLEACRSDEQAAGLFGLRDIFSYALYQNSVYAQKCVLPYYKKLGERNNRQVYETVIQIGIAVQIIENSRGGLGAQPAEGYAAACGRHIEDLIRHREYLRGWLRQLSELL